VHRELVVEVGGEVAEGLDVEPLVGIDEGSCPEREQGRGQDQREAPRDS
jgi:hypothetical protein